MLTDAWCGIPARHCNCTPQAQAPYFQGDDKHTRLPVIWMGKNEYGRVEIWVDG